MSSLDDTTPENILSYNELSHLLVDPDMLYLVARSFASHPTSSAMLRFYRFISLSIDQLETDLERHRLEQQALFTRLMESGTFRSKIHPTVQEYRRRDRFHPHGCSPSLPAPPSFGHVDTSPTPRSSTLHHAGIDEEINGERRSGMEGSKSNPIVIRDDKDVRSHCNQQEHQPEDCDTPKSTLQHCPICAWTKQTLCTHINASPAWLKELKENFEQRHQ